jgi:hypothetical protein
MRQMLKDEMKGRLAEHQVKKKSLQDEQRQKLSEFDAGKLTSGP